MKRFKNVIAVMLTVMLTVILLPSGSINAETAHSHNGIVFDQKFTYLNGDIPSGNYYLDEDITLDGGKNLPLVIWGGETVNLCLNGHVIDMYYSSIVVKFGGTLNIYDCCNDDDHKHYFTMNSDDTDDIQDGVWTLSTSETENVIKGGVITTSAQVYNPSTKDLYSDVSLDVYGTLNVDGVNFVGLVNQYVGAIWDRGGTTSIRNAKFYGNYGDHYAGAIRVIGTANIYSSEFRYNRGIALNSGDASDAGAIQCLGKTLVKDCLFEYNRGDNAGAIYCRTDDPSYGGILTMINTTVQYNESTKDGAGVHLKSYKSCFKEGTQITMPDGSKKAIEEIRENDYVKTFDHNTGELVNERVYAQFISDVKGKAFTLNFEDGNEVSVVGVHDLFSKDQMKYVSIYESNAEQFIGDHFYNATEKKWVELTSVTYDEEESNYYSIYTAHNFNCIANDMLSVPDDADHNLNIFEFDENLILDKAQLEKDIETYGLLAFEDCEVVNEKEYDEYNIQYLPIVIGKGLATMEEMLGYEDEIVENSGPTMSLSGMFNSLFAINKVSADEITAETYAADKNPGDMILGGNVVIRNNHKVNESQENNLLIEINALVHFIDGTNNFDITVQHQTAAMAVISSASNVDYHASFISENDIYKVIQNKDSKLEIVNAYDFTKITADTVSINPTEGVILAMADKIAGSTSYLSNKQNGTVVVYCRAGDSYSVIEYDGAQWTVNTLSLTELKSKPDAYVIGTIKEAAKKLISTDTGDCDVNADGEGYDEFTIGETSSSTMHIDGLTLADAGDSGSNFQNLTVMYGNRELSYGTEYTVADGSIKVTLTNDFVKTLPVGLHKVDVYVKNSLVTYSFDIKIKINAKQTVNPTPEYRVVNTSVK